MTETIATYSVEPSDDRDFNLEEIQAIADGDLAFELTELEQLNLDVAATAGWENIEEWNPTPKNPKAKRTFTGTNKKHPEIGIFVPDYTSDLNAIAAVFKWLKICYRLTYLPAMHGTDSACRATTLTCPVDCCGDNEAIALCKLLLELTPDLDDELCQKGYEQAEAETQPELERGDFVTIAGLEI